MKFNQISIDGVIVPLPRVSLVIGTHYWSDAAAANKNFNAGKNDNGLNGGGSGSTTGGAGPLSNGSGSSVMDQGLRNIIRGLADQFMFDMIAEPGMFRGLQMFLQEEARKKAAVEAEMAKMNAVGSASGNGIGFGVGIGAAISIAAATAVGSSNLNRAPGAVSLGHPVSSRSPRRVSSQSPSAPPAVSLSTAPSLPPLSPPSLDSSSS